ncbi:sugar phosphate nucleotidyltransferase [Thalassotalea sp. 1_MG-2023]|uniref:sugar phosphate nucleotidyltransferase n=1 Tax=Thalassotalea sp. 1_MG-2023 TaxID=3062680 RepID=UPI0026E1765E|nr:sugar phosphate nucleotidyltransferase [Thalassotalea sp. 1_MG-2023]MDO6427152.1 sugar phosphate nucleotidyltransferase [Thalassotalea sp. 1_MG-2023]
MKNEVNTKTLVILAAGQGSRFGRAKQFVPFGPKQITLMEYNIIQAVKAGIREVVFITQVSQKATLQEHVLPRLPKGIKTHIVLQETSNLPANCGVAKDRVKPLGTAHAVWCAKDVIKEGFIVINADDYYGEQAFANIQSLARNDFGLVAFELGKTLSAHGGVNRGLCHHTNNRLENIKEVIEITEVDDNNCQGLCEGEQVSLSKTQLVSMNFWRLTPAIFNCIEAQLIKYFPSNATNTSEQIAQEVYLPETVFAYMATTNAGVTLLTSQDAWFGVTYAADSPSVEQALNNLSSNGAFDISD